MDYNIITCNRVNRQGGGIALYIRDNLNFKIIDTLGINDDNICQSLFVEIDLNNSNVIVALYTDHLMLILNYSITILTQPLPHLIDPINHFT